MMSGNGPSQQRGVVSDFQASWNLVFLLSLMGSHVVQPLLRRNFGERYLRLSGMHGVVGLGLCVTTLAVAAEPRSPVERVGAFAALTGAFLLTTFRHGLDIRRRARAGLFTHSYHMGDSARWLRRTGLSQSVLQAYVEPLGVMVAGLAVGQAVDPPAGMLLFWCGFGLRMVGYVRRRDARERELDFRDGEVEAEAMSVGTFRRRGASPEGFMAVAAARPSGKGRVRFGRKALPPPETPDGVDGPDGLSVESAGRRLSPELRALMTPADPDVFPPRLGMGEPDGGKPVFRPRARLPEPDGGDTARL